ncbi:protein kinase [Planctomycetota bacterium]|nr:protein kinase [Planctomycetota bacterium]
MSNLNLTLNSRTKILFFQALDIESHEDRVRFLSEACENDSQLRATLERLLTNFEAAEELLDPDRYDWLIQEREILAKELAEGCQFLSNLDHGVRQFGDDYELYEELGRGTTGVVFRARQLSLNREVAIKILIGSAFVLPTERKRFQIEAEATAALKHPNIVPIYEIGSQNNYDFYSMALLPGGTLRKRMATKNIGHRDAVKLMQKVIHTVQAAHRNGIIHRDLKPDNLLLDENGEPHISDFGLAYRLEHQSSLTLIGQIVGTPQYMAPEQIDPSLGTITTAVDVYSLGVILYELLTGIPPLYDNSVLHTMQMVRNTPPKSLRTQTSSIDRDLETIVMKCLEKDPALRYQTAKALADDLDAWLEYRPITARAPSFTECIMKWVRRKPIHAALIGMTALLLLTHGIAATLTAIIQIDLLGQTEQAREEAELEKKMALKAKAKAERLVVDNRRLEYSHNMRLAAKIGRTNRLSSQNILRTLTPTIEQVDLRGWEWYFNFAKVYHEPLYLQVGSNAVKTLSFSPTGRLFAVASAQSEGCALRDGFNGTAVHTLYDSTGSHLQILWKKDGKHLATVSASGIACVWNAETGKQEATLHTEFPILSLSWDDHNDQIIALTNDNAISIWDVSNLDKISKVSRTQASIEGLTKIALSPDGYYLAGLTNDSKVYVWYANQLTQQPLILDGHRDTVTSFVWHQDGRWLATISRDKIIHIWEVPNGTQLIKLHGDEQGLIRAPNGLRLLFGGERGLLRDFDLIAGKQSIQMHDSEKDYPAPITTLDWSPNTNSYVVGLANGQIVLQRIGLPVPKRVLLGRKESLRSVAWSSDGGVVASVSETGRFFFIDAITGIAQKKVYHKPIHPIRLLAWETAGRRIATITTAPDGDQMFLINPEPRKLQQIMRFDGQKVWAIAWRSDLELFATLTDNGVIMLHNPDTGKIIRVLDVSEFELTNDGNISIDPNGEILVATGDRDQIGFWQIADGRVDSIVLPQNSPRPVKHTWSPDGKLLATGNDDGSISIWKISDKTLLNHITTSLTQAPKVAWHPNGDRLASPCKDHTIYIWDWQNGEPTMNLVGHRGNVTDLAWEPNGRLLASVSQDGTIRIWDATTGYIIDQNKLTAN